MSKLKIQIENAAEFKRRILSAATVGIWRGDTPDGGRMVQRLTQQEAANFADTVGTVVFVERDGNILIGTKGE